MLRSLSFEGIENFRDLGGYQASYGPTEFGVIYRSGSLSDMTDADLRFIEGLGIRSVVDLRSDEVKANYSDRTREIEGIAHYSLSVNGNGRLAKDREDMVGSYLEMLEEPHQARMILMAIAHVEKPLILHCVAGKDRTGVFAFLTLLANGVSFEDANADYLVSPVYLGKLRARSLERNPDFPKAVMDPDALFMTEVWDRFLDRYGSLDSYLEDFLMMGEDDIRLLKNCLGKQERSYGAVLFDEERKVLVERMQHGHFSLPKGHVEPFDKSPEDTARREILEETGLKLEILSPKTTSIEYSPYPGKAKRVTFFIGRSIGGEEKPQKEEVSSLHWLDPEDALRCLTHDSDRYVLRWAVQEHSLLGKKYL